VGVAVDMHGATPPHPLVFVHSKRPQPPQDPLLPEDPDEAGQSAPKLTSAFSPERALTERPSAPRPKGNRDSARKKHAR